MPPVQPPRDHEDLEAWEGALEKLEGHEDLLRADASLCERVFASKHEALLAGMTLGALEGDR